MKKLLVALAVICTALFVQQSRTIASPVTTMSGEIPGGWGLATDGLLTLGLGKTTTANNIPLSPELDTTFTRFKINPATLKFFIQIPSQGPPIPIRELAGF